VQSEELIQALGELKVLRHENAALKNIIELMQRNQFGSTSEKVLPPDQLLFNEIEVESKSAIPEQTELITYTRKKGRGAKKPLPENLPREEVTIDLPESEKICPHDGSPLKEIGVETTEKLKIIPAQVSVVIENRKKYACPSCQSHMAQARANSILPGTIATVELISFLIFSKFFQGLPLYRIEELFKLQGIDLKRGTMASWLIKVAEKLQPIWNILEEWALGSGYMGIDATSIQVLKEKDRMPQTKSSMWARGSPELGIVLFDYNISNAGHVAESLIAGFSGTLQADAHRGYNRLDGKVQRLGCMMHARRKFHEAFLVDKKQPGLSLDAINMIKKIYRLEEAFKEQGLALEQRHQARELELRPRMEKFRDWCEKHRPKVLPSGPLGIGINYFLDEYEYLAGFLENGRFEIDNGWIERAIRKFAIGRNNWLFCDTIDGARASGLFYSLVVTAKLNKKNPFEVMVEILNGINGAKTIDEFERLARLLVKSPTVQ
jgi:transposase